MQDPYWTWVAEVEDAVDDPATLAKLHEQVEASGLDEHHRELLLSQIDRYLNDLDRAGQAP